MLAICLDTGQYANIHKGNLEPVANFNDFMRQRTTYTCIYIYIYMRIVLVLYRCFGKRKKAISQVLLDQLRQFFLEHLICFVLLTIEFSPFLNKT